VKFLRFLVLIAALLAVYAAQYLFDQSSLEFLRSPWISQNLPSLRDLAGWSPGDHQTLGLYLAGIGALFFGLVAYGWSPLSAPADDSPPTPHRSTLGLALLGLGVSLGAALLIYFQQNQAEPFWTQALWLAAIVAYVLGSWLLTGSSTVAASAPAPERSWPAFAVLLAIAGFLLAWQLATVPVRVDGDPASHGLQALQIASGLEERIFAPGWANIPLLAYYPAAVGM